MHEKLDVAEMRMLRWMFGVPKLDKIKNERIRGMTEVGEISRKVHEKRLRWAGHVMRREEEVCGKKNDGFGSTGDEEVRQAKATMGGQNQGRHERERRTTRANAGPSCVEATRPLHRPHMKWDKMRKKKTS